MITTEREKINISKNILNIINNNNSKVLNSLNIICKKELLNLLVIYGTEIDTQVNKKFITSSINFYKNSYKSPYTNTYFPSVNTINNLDDDQMKLQEILNNIILKHIELFYLNNTIGNCYLINSKNEKINKYYFLIYKKIENQNNIKLLEYKNITEIITTDEPNLQNYIFKVNLNSVIDFKIELNEDYNNKISGNFNNQYKEEYIIQEGVVLDNNSIIEILGKLFTKSDNFCRNKLENFYIRNFVYKINKNLKNENNDNIKKLILELNN